MSEIANPQRGEVLLERPNGSPVGLRLDANALCVVERTLGGRSLSQIALELTTGQISVTTVRALLWAAVQGYRAKHPPKKKGPFTLEDAGNLISDVGLTKAAQVTLEALNLALPRQEDADDEGDGDGGDDDDQEGDESSSGASGTGDGS